MSQSGLFALADLLPGASLELTPDQIDRLDRATESF